MLIRNGFISNSSTSSFVVIGYAIPNLTVEIINDFIHKFATTEQIDEISNLLKTEDFSFETNYINKASEPLEKFFCAIVEEIGLIFDMYNFHKIIGKKYDGWDYDTRIFDHKESQELLSEIGKFFNKNDIKIVTGTISN